MEWWTFLDALASLELVIRVTHCPIIFFVRYQINRLQISIGYIDFQESTFTTIQPCKLATLQPYKFTIYNKQTNKTYKLTKKQTNKLKIKDKNITLNKDAKTKRQNDICLICYLICCVMFVAYFVSYFCCRLFHICHIF